MSNNLKKYNRNIFFFDDVENEAVPTVECRLCFVGECEHVILIDYLPSNKFNENTYDWDRLMYIYRKNE